MAECEYCGLEMLESDSCTFKFETINCAIYKRTCGNDGRRCHDCGIILHDGNAHHPQCDSEYCPVCGDHSLGCACRHGPMYTALTADKTVSPPLSDRVEL